MKSNPNPTESAAILRLAIAAELEAAKTEASALARLTEAKSRYIEACCEACEGDNYDVAIETGERFIDAEQTHFTARRAHQAAIDLVSGAKAWMKCHASEAACPWTGVKSTLK